jgi:hypothetical protein
VGEEEEEEFFIQDQTGVSKIMTIEDEKMGFF